MESHNNLWKIDLANFFMVSLCQFLSALQSAWIQHTSWQHMANLDALSRALWTNVVVMILICGCLGGLYARKASHIGDFPREAPSENCNVCIFTSAFHSLLEYMSRSIYERYRTTGDIDPARHPWDALAENLYSYETMNRADILQS